MRPFYTRLELNAMLLEAQQEVEALNKLIHSIDTKTAHVWIVPLLDKLDLLG